MEKDKIAKLTLSLYEKMGAKGMKSLTNKERDEAMLKFIFKFLKKDDKILDLACGYGRITIPLAKIGFNIKGIDLVPSLIKEAKRRAKEEKVNVEFKIGDMRGLPYQDESFNKVLCLWSSFNHLLDEDSQIKALQEIHRVLKNKGACLIDMPDFENKWSKEQVKKFGRIVPYILNGLKVFDYVHDKNTLNMIIKFSGFTDYKIKIINLRKRRRIIIFLNKK